MKQWYALYVSLYSYCVMNVELYSYEKYWMGV